MRAPAFCLSVQALFAKRSPGGLNYGRRLSCLGIIVAWDDGAMAEGRPASSMARRMIRPSKSSFSSPSATVKIEQEQEQQAHMTSRKEPMASAARPLHGTVKGCPARGGLKPWKSPCIVAVDDTCGSNERGSMFPQTVTLPKPTQSEAAQQRICIRWFRRLCSHRSRDGERQGAWYCDASAPIEGAERRSC